MNDSMFNRLVHPFVWTKPQDRLDVLANANDPLWHRFLEESERHFQKIGGLRPSAFPMFCHDGDLDEVMTVAVLAYTRDELRYWNWLADWLRGVLAYYREAEPVWRENRFRIMRGEKSLHPAMSTNPRQHFEGFTRGGLYWVEAGFNSALLHILDLMMAYAPQALVPPEVDGLLEAVSNYAVRYAFHEEALKYNNRGMWANGAILLAGIAHSDPDAGKLLRFQAFRRNEELRSTFLDDGFHAEGAPDYHLMAADAVLSFALTASHMDPTRDAFAGSRCSDNYGRFPSFLEIVRAYLSTVIPGPVPWNHPRGCSVSTAIPVRPALLYAWKLGRDPEIGWFLKMRIAAGENSNPTPLPVTKIALLGLGQYQPLMNFWLYRPVDVARQPKVTMNVLPDHGSFFSRSCWDKEASCITTRFGYEGTGKGHRDHAHVTLTVGGTEVLKDPFPRKGPPGLESSIFHNTVTLDHMEPAPVIGVLHSSLSIPGADAALTINSGGALPKRLFLHDPREESNYWFTSHPETPDFQFHRAVLHVHDSYVLILDRLAADRVRLIDWFFHSSLASVGYNITAEPRFCDYQLRQRDVVSTPAVVKLPLRGTVVLTSPYEWHEAILENASISANLGFMSPDASLEIERGHWEQKHIRSNDGISFPGELDYFFRIRANAEVVHALWVINWKTIKPNIALLSRDDRMDIQINEPDRNLRWDVNFDLPGMDLHITPLDDA